MVILQNAVRDSDTATVKRVSRGRIWREAQEIEAGPCGQRRESEQIRPTPMRQRGEL
jgi:hypothetical protein